MTKMTSPARLAGPTCAEDPHPSPLPEYRAREQESQTRLFKEFEPFGTYSLAQTTATYDKMSLVPKRGEAP